MSIYLCAYIIIRMYAIERQFIQQKLNTNVIRGFAQQ